MGKISDAFNSMTGSFATTKAMQDVRTKAMSGDQDAINWLRKQLNKDPGRGAGGIKNDLMGTWNGQTIKLDPVQVQQYLDMALQKIREDKLRDQQSTQQAKQVADSVWQNFNDALSWGGPVKKRRVATGKRR